MTQKRNNNNNNNNNKVSDRIIYCPTVNSTTFPAFQGSSHASIFTQHCWYESVTIHQFTACNLLLLPIVSLLCQQYYVSSSFPCSHFLTCFCPLSPNSSTSTYEARVRFGTRVRVRVRDSAIFEKGGCGCGRTRRLKNY